MFESGEPARGAVAIGRVAPAVRLKLLLLFAEVVVGSPLLARFGLIGMAIVLQTYVIYAPGHFRAAPNAFFACLISIATLGSLALCLYATFPLRTHAGTRLRQIFALAALTVLPILAMMGAGTVIGGIAAVSHGTPYNNDGAVMDLYAANRVLEGHSPYMKTSIVTALADMNAPATTTTPLMLGQFRGAQAYPSSAAVQQVFLNVLKYRPRTIPPEFESNYNYPSGSFLFILPFVWAGIRDMRFLYALAVIAMGFYIASKMPRSLRLLVPIVVLADVPLVAMTAGGQPDPLYALFLMIGYAEWSSPWLSPTCMGLAIGTKQLSWFFLPFYVLLMLREYGLREALRRCGIMAGVFLLMNGPFIVHAPASYLRSIGGPMMDPMFPLGVGAIALFTAGVLPMLPKLAFTLAEIGVWAGSLYTNTRWRALTPATAAVLGALPLFFAWRSLANYFYLVPLLALAIVLADGGRQRLQRARV